MKTLKLIGITTRRRHIMRFLVSLLALLTLVAAAVPVAAQGIRVEPLPEKVKVKFALNPAIVSFLAIFYAADQGYFDRAGLDVEIVTYRGPAVTQLPLLARGDLDMAVVAPAPGFYNQAAQGFDIKIFASMGVETRGRIPAVRLTVLKEKATEIKDLKDLRGKTIEAAAEGSAISFLVGEALRQAGLTPGQDVTVHYRVRGVPDMLALAKAKAADVIGMVEPIASQAEKEGLVVRWKTFDEIAPWYQPGFIGASSRFLDKHRAAVTKFTEVYLLTSREINGANGVWTGELIKTASKWTKVDPQTIKDQGGVPAYDPNGAIWIESLERTQEIWAQHNLVKQKVDVRKVVDLAVLEEALKKTGRAR